MTVRPIDLLGAPTNLGNRPYEDTGEARLTTLGPGRLREHGLVARLQARDLGDVAAAPYRDFVRPPGGVRNEDLIDDHLRAIEARLERRDRFMLLVAGDCSVLPATVAGVGGDRKPMLVYIDAHSDFATPETSETGGAAGMDLAFVTGRGSSILTRRLLRDSDIVAYGVRAGSFDGSGIQQAQSSEQILGLIGDRPFLVHVDADVLDPRHFPFVDSPEPGGASPDELASLLAPLVRHPHALGMELTIYDPRHDHDGRGAELLVALLESAFRGSTRSQRLP